MIPTFPVGTELLLELAVAGIIVAAFGIAAVVHRDDRRLLIGDIAGVIVGLLFLGEAMLPPPPSRPPLTVLAGVFIIVLFAAYGIGWRDQLPSGDDAPAE